MSELSQTALQSLLQSASADLETIAAMLRFIRDNVAPMITDFDLKNVALRHSVRARISPHPTLYRATMAAEAAYAAMRGAQFCISAAKTLLPATFARHSSEIAYGEAKYWERQAKDLRDFQSDGGDRCRARTNKVWEGDENVRAAYVLT